jgi:ribosome biogenesis protein NSA1
MAHMTHLIIFVHLLSFMEGNVVVLMAAAVRVWAANGTGHIQLLDLQQKKLLDALKGAGGSVRGLALHPAGEPLLASVGLDRFLRVHNTTGRESVGRVYLKQQLNAVCWLPRPAAAAGPAAAAAAGPAAAAAGVEAAAVEAEQQEKEHQPKKKSKKNKARQAAEGNLEAAAGTAAPLAAAAAVPTSNSSKKRRKQAAVAADV